MPFQYGMRLSFLHCAVSAHQNSVSMCCFATIYVRFLPKHLKVSGHTHAANITIRK